MRRLLAAAVLAFLQTLVAALALGAADAVLAVAAVAVVASVSVWLAAWHEAGEESGLPLAGSAGAVALTLVGRSTPAALLPLLTAHVVGAVLAGAVALGLGTASDGVLVWDEPGLAVLAVGGLVIGVLVAWATLAVDGDAHPAWVAGAPLVSGAVLGVGLAAAVLPAVPIGLAVAGLLSWSAALVAAGATLLGAVLGAFALSWLTPAPA